MSRGLRTDWRFTLGVISGGHFFSHFYMLTLPPLFPLLRREFVLNNTELGLIAAALIIGGLVQAPVGGVVDRIGPKWVFVLGLAVTAGGIALVGVGQTYPAVLALAVGSGVGQAAFHPADYTIISAVTDRHLEGRAFSFHSFSGISGFAAAPVVVGTLGFALGWRAAVVAVGAVGLLYALFAAVVLHPEVGTPAGGATVQSPDVAGPRPSFWETLARPSILAMVGFFLTMSFASKGIHTFTTILAVDAYGLTEAEGGLMLTALFALGGVGVLVGGVLADRRSPGAVIGISLAVGALLLVATVAVGDALGVWSLVALFGLVGFFVTLVLPSRDRLVSELSADGTMGRSFGIVFTGGTAGGLVGPVVLGALGDATTIPLSFVVIGGCFVGAGLLAYVIWQRWLAVGSRTAVASG